MKTFNRSKAPLRRLEGEHPFREPRRLNPYRTQMKPKGPVLCKLCGALLKNGKWFSPRIPGKQRFSETPSKPTPDLSLSKTSIKKGTCPACQQIKDHFALGVIEIHSKNWKLQETEILRTIYNTERVAQRRNNQHRIMWIQTVRGVPKIYVTFPELARHLGRELVRSFKGSVEYQRSDQENFLRVRWHSESGAPRRPVLANHRSRDFRRRSRILI